MSVPDRFSVKSLKTSYS